VALSKIFFRRVQLSPNNANYDLLIKICELVHSALLPQEGDTGTKFSDFLDDEKLMAGVFEAFVRNFFKTEQNEFTVGSEYIQWESVAQTAEMVHFLPTMRTDVTLRSRDRIIILDTKYYAEALIRKFWSEEVKAGSFVSAVCLFEELQIERCKYGSARRHFALSDHIDTA
jgi:5-methylcytosine-specific restriction enzyme subunit McrC